MNIVRTAFCLLLAATPALAQDRWQLAWSDEFNGPAGSAPDLTKWTYDLGATGWGNKELENYTDSRQNSFLDGKGNLVIRVLKTADGYTSARLKTLGKYSVTYGKIEARIRIPFGQGIWPAFWMLGTNLGRAGWPASGEIDIMENIGREPATVHGTVHGPGYSGDKGPSKAFELTNTKFADDFHVFTVIWQKDSIEFLVDGHSYHKVTPLGIPQGTRWVFDTPMFLLLNVAVGGSWPGYPDATSTYPQEMLVDYVRVYRQ